MKEQELPIQIVEQVEYTEQPIEELYSKIQDELRNSEFSKPIKKLLDDVDFDIDKLLHVLVTYAPTDKDVITLKQSIDWTWDDQISLLFILLSKGLLVESSFINSNLLLQLNDSQLQELSTKVDHEVLRKAIEPIAFKGVFSKSQDFIREFSETNINSLIDQAMILSDQAIEHLTDKHQSLILNYLLSINSNSSWVSYFLSKGVEPSINIIIDTIESNSVELLEFLKEQYSIDRLSESGTRQEYYDQIAENHLTAMNFALMTLLTNQTLPKSLVDYYISNIGIDALSSGDFLYSEALLSFLQVPNSVLMLSPVAIDFFSKFDPEHANQYRQYEFNISCATQVIPESNALNNKIIQDVIKCLSLYPPDCFWNNSDAQCFFNPEDNVLQFDNRDINLIHESTHLAVFRCFENPNASPYSKSVENHDMMDAFVLAANQFTQGVADQLLQCAQRLNKDIDETELSDFKDLHYKDILDLILDTSIFEQIDQSKPLELKHIISGLAMLCINYRINGVDNLVMELATALDLTENDHDQNMIEQFFHDHNLDHYIISLIFGISNAYTCNDYEAELIARFVELVYYHESKALEIPEYLDGLIQYWSQYIDDVLQRTMDIEIYSRNDLSWEDDSCLYESLQLGIDSDIFNE
ncbi:MAG: hypothetical protein AB8B67_00695 [Rickettsiaceae bacterium]